MAHVLPSYLSQQATVWLLEKLFKRTHGSMNMKEKTRSIALCDTSAYASFNEFFRWTPEELEILLRILIWPADYGIEIRWVRNKRKSKIVGGNYFDIQWLNPHGVIAMTKFLPFRNGRAISRKITYLYPVASEKKRGKRWDQFNLFSTFIAEKDALLAGGGPQPTMYVAARDDMLAMDPTSLIAAFEARYSETRFDVWDTIELIYHKRLISVSDIFAFASNYITATRTAESVTAAVQEAFLHDQLPLPLPPLPPLPRPLAVVSIPPRSDVHPMISSYSLPIAHPPLFPMPSARPRIPRIRYPESAVPAILYTIPSMSEIDAIERLDNTYGLKRVISATRLPSVKPAPPPPPPLPTFVDDEVVEAAEDDEIHPLTPFDFGMDFDFDVELSDPTLFSIDDGCDDAADDGRFDALDVLASHDNSYGPDDRSMLIPGDEEIEDDGECEIVEPVDDGPIVIPGDEEIEDDGECEIVEPVDTSVLAGLSPGMTTSDVSSCFEEDLVPKLHSLASKINYTIMRDIVSAFSGFKRKRPETDVEEPKTKAAKFHQLTSPIFA